MSAPLNYINFLQALLYAMGAFLSKNVNFFDSVFINKMNKWEVNLLWLI